MEDFRIEEVQEMCFSDECLGTLRKIQEEKEKEKEVEVEVDLSGLFSIEENDEY